jgi:hypothetical protein
VYGYPDGGMMDAAERGEVALGGCMVGIDDPDRACPRCLVHLHRDRTYRLGDRGMGVALARSAGTLTEAVLADGSLTVSRTALYRGSPEGPGRTLVKVAGDDVGTAVLMLLVQRFGDVDDVAAWLDARSIPHDGEDHGPLIQVVFDDEHLVLQQAAGSTRVHTTVADRVVLGALADLLMGTFDDVAALASWFSDHDLLVRGSAAG